MKYLYINFRFLSKTAGLLVLFVFVLYGSLSAQSKLEVWVDPTKVENRIDPKLYGFLLEHIYHSVSNGVWGENVWNRSFEERLAYGNWKVGSNKNIELDALANSEMSDFRIGFGENFELNLQLMRLEGSGPILIGVRDQVRERMLTNRLYWYLGLEENSMYKLEANTGWIWHTPRTKTSVAASGTVDIRNKEWIDVKIKCHDDIVSGWINGVLKFSTPIINCPKDGTITLGGKNCRLMFRNIQVRSLDDSLVNLRLDPIRHWHLIGQGNVSLVNSDVVNDKYAVLINSYGDFAGIEQKDIYKVSAKDKLLGSLYIKGSVKSASVRILKGKKVLSEQLINNISGQWRKIQLSLLSSEDVNNATLQIIAKSKGQLFIDQVSLMHKSSIDNNGYRVDLFSAVKDLKPTALRWPGGSFSEQYRFENGLGMQEDRIGILRWDDYDPLSFGTDEFLSYCKLVGAEPQIVVPIGYHNYDGYAPNKNGKQDWLQRALDWMDYCNGDSTTVMGRKRIKNGHVEPYNVKYWEIDNEVWKMSPYLYADIAKQFSIAMKQRYPYVKIIGCGCGRLGREGAGLDSILIHSIAEHIDYISPHYYQTIDKFANDGVSEYGDYLDKLAGWIAKSKNPKMKIFLSEWNLDGIDMRTGLFAGGFLNRLEATPAVQMAAPALFLRHISAPGWNNAFINFNHSSWFPAPNYVVLRLWRSHYLPNRISLKGDTGELNVIATASEDKKKVCLKIVNPTDNEMTLVVKKGKMLGVPSWRVVGSSSLFDKNSMLQPDCVKESLCKIVVCNADYILQVPPYSASVLNMIK